MSVSAEAERRGVVNGMTAINALQICPYLELRYYSEEREIITYWSEQMIDAILNLKVPIEKCSDNEFFIDLTDMTCDTIFTDNDIARLPIKADEDFRLVLKLSLLKDSSLAQSAALLKFRVLDTIFEKTGINCSAGLSFNKMLARTACLHDPTDGIVILATNAGITRVFRLWTLDKCVGYVDQKIREVSDAVIDELNWPWSFFGKWRTYMGWTWNKPARLCTMDELSRMSLESLSTRFGKEYAEWLCNISRGVDNTPVKHKPWFDTIAVEKMYPNGMILNATLINCD